MIGGGCHHRAGKRTGKVATSERGKLQGRGQSWRRSTVFMEVINVIAGQGGGAAADAALAG